MKVSTNLTQLELLRVAQKLQSAASHVHEFVPENQAEVDLIASANDKFATALKNIQYEIVRIFSEET